MIPEGQAELDAFLEKFFPKRASTGPPERPSLARPSPDIVDRASKAQNGARFTRLWSGDWSGEYPSQSEADLALCSMLAFWTQKDAAQIDSLFRQSGLFREKWDERHYGDGRTYGQETIARAVAGCVESYDAEKRPTSAVQQDPANVRPSIHLEPGQLPRVVDEAEEALLNAKGEGLFQRGGVLVRLIRTEAESARRGLRRHAGALLIKPTETPYLVERLTAAATWLRYDKRSQGWIACDCPERMAATLAARGTWRLRNLTGVVEAPTLRADGSVLDLPGYDEVTGLFYDPGATAFPRLKARPTREDALEGLRAFQAVLSGFPFVDQPEDGRPGSDLAAAVAAILTALVRRSLRSAPLFAFRAPKMGSGKSLLADVVSMVAAGRPCAVMSLGGDANEERKRWLSVLLEGEPVVCIDNVERPLGGSTLCSILTQETYKDRILGMSRTVSVSTAVTLLCTGNNLVFDGDLTTRVIPCDLDPGVERPEERQFEVNLYRHVPQHRGELVVAGLTILRAYVVAGRPAQPIPTFGRFEEWSDLVRSALVWLGTADPCAGRARIEEQDPTRQRLGQLLTAWKEALPGRHATVAEAIRLAEGDTQGDGPASGSAASRLRDALLAVAADRGGRINPRYVGSFLVHHARRIEGGLRFERGSSRANVATWGVSEVAAEGVPRVSRVCSSARERTGSAEEKDIPVGDVGHDPSDPSDPLRTCPVCRSTEFWTSAHGVTVCRRCHPGIRSNHEGGEAPPGSSVVRGG
ncbi:MAG: hypothetical protein EDX89_23530 [Acidobacteria bacterium]|nr:MAG: hypothetical protein EDX89_23530 [Acidobacteriota bacterium]